jgi:hypothetical protein
LRHRGLQSLHPGLGRAEIGGLLIDDLGGRGAALEQRLIACEVAAILVARGLGVGEIGLRLQDFGRLAAGVEVGELVLGLRELPRDLLGGGAIVGVVLVEQRRALGDPVAARDPNRRDQALLRRSDLDEIRLGVALPFDDRRVARRRRSRG